MTSLGSVPALRVLSAPAREAVVRDSRPVRFGTGAVVRPYGEPARSVLVVLSGTVVAAHLSSSGAQMWPERWTGPVLADKPAVLGGGVPPSGLVALTAVTARLLPRQRFLRLLDEEPAFREHVLRRLARDALDSRRRLAQATTLPAAGRVAAWLGAQDPADRVAWRGSQEQLARMLGMSRVSVNRALTKLAGAGAVRMTDRGIVVGDRGRLGLIAEQG